MSGLPYEVETIIWVTDNTKRTIADDRRIIDKVLASFHKRIVAVTINTIVAIPDITINAFGAAELPCKS